MYELVKMLASMGMLTEADANTYVELGSITPEQYQALIGKEYVAPAA